ncbi:MAG: lysophospholipid acyltransferase family protein [Xanthomonadales bacterium]|nr:lysophospholipid acyltransferase family protein [Gammaproteobacteria bacterium]NNL94134.1 lysophospholipid acyltransferase family protein [Xanthomonadales bacterium]
MSLKFLLFSGVVRLISLFSTGLLAVLSRPLGWLTWRASKTKRASTLRNLSACYPDMTPRDRQKLARESMRHYVLLALETGIAWYWSRGRLMARFKPAAGLEHLEDARSKGKGVMFLVPHSGSWELLQLWLNQGLKMYSLYKPGRYPEFDEKLLRKRQRFGGTMAPTSSAGIRVLLKALKANHNVLILPDQDPSDGDGRFAPFFGVQADTPVLASRLCRQTGCAALFAVCRRTADSRYQVHLVPAEEAFYSEDLDRSLAAMNRGVEKCIAIDPAQYLWAYKRFKSRPEGEPRFYSP